MSGEGRNAETTPRVRPFITLSIQPGSKLSDGRLPLAKRKLGDGLEVDLDPVSFAALLATAGRLFSVDQVAREIDRLRGSMEGENSDVGTGYGKGES